MPSAPSPPAVPVPDWVSTNVIETVPLGLPTMLLIPKPLLGTGGGGTTVTTSLPHGDLPVSATFVPANEAWK